MAPEIKLILVTEIKSLLETICEDIFQRLSRILRDPLLPAPARSGLRSTTGSRIVGTPAALCRPPRRKGSLRSRSSVPLTDRARAEFEKLLAKSEDDNVFPY